jgi:hypothetical protein
MSDAIWETEHSVETIADQAFAWTYMSDVKNWNDPPAEFTLDGPFTSGAHGTTQIPGQPPKHWQLLEVIPTQSYTITFSLDAAALSFEWCFSELSGRGSKLTQHIALTGEGASVFVSEVQQAFASSLAPGMNRIAAAIDNAYSARHTA